jgi:CBS-domain-containing membrane protein
MTMSGARDGADPGGERTEVGEMLRGGTLAIAETCSFRDALDILQADDRRTVAVVDADQVLVGVVHEMSLAHGGRSGHLEMVASLDGRVTAAMSSALAVHETMPIRTALRLLASTHSREATVVTSEGTPLGVFRDIDGMRWISQARESPDPRPRDAEPPTDAEDR